MKTTTQDSNHNQENSTPEVDAKNQQAEIVKPVERDSSANPELDNQISGDQLTLPLAVTDTIAMVSDDDKAKKRKQEKEEDDQKAKADKQEIAEDAEGQIDSDGQTEAPAEELAEESLVSEALEGEAGSVSDMGGFSDLSATTIFLSAFGILGAASYYKNINKDQAPSFTSLSRADDIDENSGAGQVVYTAVAEDDAGEDAVITYSLADGSDAALSIDATSGEVTLSANPDHEIQSQYSFAVIATDAAGNASEPKSVILVITDLDEVAPTIDSDDIADSVNENTGAGQVIYTATADDSADVSDGVTFSLAEGSDPALSIDANTGAVTLNTDPDHEAQSQYSFSVVATDAAGNASDAQSVTLDINDLDDAAPTITSGDTADTINENSGAGQIIYTASADDSGDDIVDGPIAFSLAEGSDPALSIDANTGAVTLNADPDHEAQSQYSFSVVATDAAGNASDAQAVTLDINDVDDAAPTITSGDTADAINENTGAGQVIYTAAADDSGDDIADGPIAFSLAEGSDSALSIDASTGEVTLNVDPDHEIQSQYSFAVIATDGAGNASAAQSVTLDINNLDDTAPVITSANSADSVNENTGAGQVVYTATADDSADVSDGVTFSLAEGSDPALSIDANTGAVTLNTDPDHEAQSQYSFSVVATDAAGNASDAQSVTLDINDLDDAAPTITSGDTADTINENSGAGQIIYTASADDSGDDIVDGPIAFSLAEGSDPALSIDANTGAVTLNADPDHEAQSQYSFSVVATDAAGNASAAQSVTLDINDLDDAAPTITSGDTADTINENSGAGQVIYTASADDSGDDIVDGPIAFSLAEGSDSALSIDASTGEVTLNVDPDHEIQSQYSFAVIATDGAGNASAAQSVTLDINNLDDTAPVITSANSADSVNENTGAGQVVYTATADDSADVSDGVTFSLAEGSDPALSIDANTGAVTLNTNPDHEAQSQYSFSVVATDAAGNVSDAQSVTLDINDLDDAAPTITSGDAADAINENTGAGQVIYTASADDSGDDIADGPIAFSLAEGSDSALSIDASTGEVTLSTDPDHEIQSQYSFAVIATDGAGNASAAQSVTLDINDLDDAAPTITSASVADDLNADAVGQLDENSGKDKIIYTATADDSADDVADGPISFSLTDDSDEKLTIDSISGVVTLNTNPDYEAQAQYSFGVIATDGAGNASEAQSVTLDIRDLDDAAPQFTSLSDISINENIQVGQVVYTAEVDDSADISDGVEFSLLPGHDEALQIDPNSGEVVLTEAPDFELKPEIIILLF